MKAAFENFCIALDEDYFESAAQQSIDVFNTEIVSASDEYKSAPATEITHSAEHLVAADIAID